MLLKELKSFIFFFFAPYQLRTIFWEPRGWRKGQDQKRELLQHGSLIESSTCEAAVDQVDVAKGNLERGKMMRLSTDSGKWTKETDRNLWWQSWRAGPSEFNKRQRILKWTFPQEVALTRHAQYAVQTAGSTAQPLKTLGQESVSGMSIYTLNLLKILIRDLIDCDVLKLVYWEQVPSIKEPEQGSYILLNNWSVFHMAYITVVVQPQ